MTQELRKLAEAATQGKWSQTPPSGIYQGRMIVTDDRAACIGETHNANATENAAFIAAASPAAILALLDRLEKAEKDAERYRLHREVGGQIWHLSGTRTRATGEYFDFATDEILAKQLEASK